MGITLGLYCYTLTITTSVSNALFICYSLDLTLSIKTNSYNL